MPGADVLAMDVARYGDFATPKYTNIKVNENYRRRFRLTYPNEEMPAARPFRRTPVYDRLKERGAVFGANSAWRTRSGSPRRASNPTRNRPIGVRTLTRMSAPNAARCAPMSGSTRPQLRQVRGRGEGRASLARPGLRLPHSTARAHGDRALLNERGRVTGDLSIACLSEDRYFIVGSGFAEAYYMRWFWRQRPPDDVHVRSACSTLTGFAISGPNARTLMQSLVAQDMSNAAFKFFAVKEMPVGLSPAIVQRCGFTGELGYEIWVTPDYQLQLYDDILAAGETMGLAHYGGRAISSLRMEKNYGSFNKDFRPDHTVGERGSTCSWISRRGISSARRRHPPRRKKARSANS